MACLHSKDLDQPEHLPGLIKVLPCAHYITKDPSFVHADCQDSDQTRGVFNMHTIQGWMPLIATNFNFFLCVLDTCKTKAVCIQDMQKNKNSPVHTHTKKIWETRQ